MFLYLSKKTRRIKAADLIWISTRGEVMRKTKIICTIGPATFSEEMMRRLIENGMNVARLNFSHGEHAEHKKTIELIKRLRKEYGKPIAILLDTRGPGIRVKKFRNGGAELKDGSEFILTSGEIEGDETKAALTFADLAGYVKKGTKILLDDGFIELEVRSVKGNDVICRVVSGGFLRDNKSVNIPGIDIDMNYVSEKDREDILFGIENDVDFIAASFCRRAADILDIRRILLQNGGSRILIIAKIENQSGVDNIEDIVKVSDGIMIARGDMGVEIDLVEIPRLQKVLIKQAVTAGKMVVTATQMLDSMIHNPRPTRAETTDVANAVYDGTSAIMLSGETAAGAHPIESLIMMSRIATHTEQAIHYKKRFNSMPPETSISVTNAISHAVCSTAQSLNAGAILAVTKSGRTARMASSYRPAVPIIGCTPSKKTYQQLALSWGICPILTEEKENTDALFEHVVERAKAEGLVKHGEVVVITAGVPIGVSGTTNTLKVQIVGNVLVKGEGINNMAIRGKLCVCNDPEKVKEAFEPGDILVVTKTDNSIMEVLKEASGIITEQAGFDSHAAIVGLSLGIPVLFGAENATKILKTGTTVTLDTGRDMVYTGISEQ
jgi:pyruvate kinase